eukprot:846734-Pelagomonas_calceolata.AAC.1
MSAHAPVSFTKSARTFNCMLHGPNHTHDTEQCRKLQAIVANKKAAEFQVSSPVLPDIPKAVIDAAVQEVLARLSVTSTQNLSPQQKWPQPTHSYATPHVRQSSAQPQSSAAHMSSMPGADAPDYGRECDRRGHMNALHTQARSAPPAPASQHAPQVHMTRYPAPTTEPPDGAHCAFAQMPASDNIQPV